MLTPRYQDEGSAGERDGRKNNAFPLMLPMPAVLLAYFTASAFRERVSMPIKGDGLYFSQR